MIGKFRKKNELNQLFFSFLIEISILGELLILF